MINYTPELTTEIVAKYTAGTAVETIATEAGRTVRSVVAKLSKEGVYVSKKSQLAGKREMLKAEMVTEISTLVNVPEEILESLEKATGPALRIVLEALRKAWAGLAPKGPV